MADALKTEKTGADRALDATVENARATQRRLEGLLEVSKLARDARKRGDRDEDRGLRQTR